MTTIKQRLCYYLCEKPDDIPRPFTTLQHRSSQYIRRILQYQFPAAHIRIADTDYSAPTRAEFEAWLHNDNVNAHAYHPEWFDCDDFARALRCKIFKIGQQYKTTFTIAYCEGYTDDSYHAYNLLIDGKDMIYIVEPQNDRCVPVGENQYRTDFIQL